MAETNVTTQAAPTIVYAETTTVNSTTPTSEGTSPAGLNDKQIGIIVGVLLAVLLITAVVLFILLRRRKMAKRQSIQQPGGSGVYEATTAPIDDESKEMLKEGDQHEMKPKDSEKNTEEKVENVNESSPLKETPNTAVADPNESSVTLVNNDGNAEA